MKLATIPVVAGSVAVWRAVHCRILVGEERMHPLIFLPSLDLLRAGAEAKAEDTGEKHPEFIIATCH